MRLLLSLTALALVTPSPIPQTTLAQQAPAPLPGVAVVELFTSEGCSSCPPADRVLASLAARGGSVYALSFHVDYWDHLGWADPFSSAAATARQRSYARALGVGVYTPQMIVNGQAPFVGSNTPHASRRVETALGTAAQARVEIGAVQRSGDRVTVAVQANGVSGVNVVVAVVEGQVERRVTRGENAGRVLRHANVVRVFGSIAGPRGEVTLTLPRDLDASDATVVAYAQVPATRTVVGASARPLEGVAPAARPVTPNRRTL